MVFLAPKRSFKGSQKEAHLAKDTTFTAGDIIRLFCGNLSKEEQKEVALFFMVIYPGLLLTNSEVFVILAKLKSFTPSWLFRNVLSLFMIMVGEIRTFLNTTWANVIFDNPETRKEVIACIDARLKRALKEESPEEILEELDLLEERGSVRLRGESVLSTGRVLKLNH